MIPESPIIEPAGASQSTGSTTEELAHTRSRTVEAPADHRRRRAPWVIALAAVLLAAGVALGITDPFADGPASHPVAGSADPTSLARVTRQDLSSQTQVSATLGYAGSYSVVNQAQGTLTALPSVGQVVTQGQVLYQVSGAPVVLLYGSTPAYRNLSEGPRRRM